MGVLPAEEARAHVGQINRALVFEVWTNLQIARILGWLAIDDTRIRVGAIIVGRLGCVEVEYHIAHRLSVLAETNRVFGFVLCELTSEWLVVAEETAERAEIIFGLFVVAADNGIVRTLLLSCELGATVEAVMSSSSEILAAGMKSLRSPKVRQDPCSV